MTVSTLSIESLSLERAWSGNRDPYEPEVTYLFVPDDLLIRYVTVAMRGAVPQQLEGSGWYADLPGFPGVWGNGPSLKECLDSLADILREWVVVKLAKGDRDVPVLDTIDLNVLSR